MNRPSKHLARTLLALSLATLWGCSSSLQAPTAPSVTGTGSLAPSLPGLVGTLPDTSAGGQTLPAPTTPRDSAEVVISPVASDVGAVLRAGCLELRVPPGALAADATIEMKVRPNGRGVELHIYPESLNHFLVPLELTTDVSAMPEGVQSAAAWFWVDESNGDWVLIEASSVDRERGTLTAPLHHFSKYEVGNRNLGKAGW